MRQLTTLFAGIFMLAIAAFSCNNTPEAAPAASPVGVGSLSMSKAAGADCDKPDTLRFNCVEVNLNWPEIGQGSDPLKKSVASWTNAYLVGILAPPSNPDEAASMSLDDAVQSFIKSQQEFIKEAPDSPAAQWLAETHDTILLNDGKHLTLQIDGYAFQGGAHGSPSSAVATFEAATGKQLGWDDLVTDKAALQSMAEQKFKAERPDLFQPTDGSEPFAFDDIFPFALPQNFGLVEQGIYFLYIPYEVGPYAIGGTSFVLTFEELGALLKK